MGFEFLPTPTGATDTAPLEGVACFQLFDTLVDGVTVHVGGTGEGSNPTETIRFGLTSSIVALLFFVQFWQSIPPLLFDAYLFSGHGTYTVPQVGYMTELFVVAP